MLPADLLTILACPKSQRPLIYFPRGEGNTSTEPAFLLCPASRLRYRIEAGVPVMLVEEAEELSAPQVAALVSRAKELGLQVPASS